MIGFLLLYAEAAQYGAGVLNENRTISAAGALRSPTPRTSKAARWGGQGLEDKGKIT